MERSSLFKLIGSILIAVIFVGSYAAFGNYSAPQPKHTTTTVQSFYPIGYAVANASVIGYGPVFTISSMCNGTATTTAIANILNGLESNGSISNYYLPDNQTISVEAGSMNTSSIYFYIASRLNFTAYKCARFAASADLLLPGALEFNVNGQKFSAVVPASLRNSSVTVNLNATLQKVVRVRIATLFNANGTIYGNMTVTRI